MDTNCRKTPKKKKKRRRRRRRRMKKNKSLSAAVSRPFRPLIMKSEARQDCLRKSSQTVTAACSQLWENVQASTSTTLGEDTYSSVDQQNGGMQQKHLKDEPKQDSLYSLADYCSSFFDNRKVVSSPDVLIPDTSVAIGVTNQAGQTCPPGVVLQDPANPDAVFNTEETVSADVHSGSSQGDATNQEDDMMSPFSWVRRVRLNP
ncbi:hypothetical protein AMELA_G00176050 [Ameiurus melas]|uniref:Uncharacterized protein n=1 Tax=Ameiurus melas TaxID=219545 RepID=A0A7J6AD41_AMEME|nr:hypothetical protein AMELA_G00176050 [Ameiurus melas]